MDNKEQLILRISGIFVIVGLIIIYVASIFYNPKLISISEINSDLIGRTIKTYGNITYINYKNNNLFLKISDLNSNIFVVKFDVNKNIPIANSLITNLNFISVSFYFLMNS